ncbi:insulin-like growth factor II isoform X2 [Sinocyclocheilus grahami]|uniref:insulin-like growth factor II isoform X2 n=1 Tax=Sinocyclocheilus grahami TaxID=75366 RepID=UPI0007AC5B8C|nr:PREDICTED: insulin-like growth factor II isoform X2 [Sinocyclocheilus grahami]
MCPCPCVCVCVCVCVCAIGPSPPGPPIRAHRSKNVSSSLERPDLEKKDMPSDGMPTCHARRLQMRREFLKVPSWRSVCVLYSLYCILILPDAGEAAKPRCGRELVADLEFVCGDRGFYRGKPGAARSGGPRSRGKGIVEQCCVRACDLQHLESYCAKPKRLRRDVPASLQQTPEDQFWLVFQRRYQKHAEMNRDADAASQRLRERTLYRRNSRDSVLLTNQPSSTLQQPSTERMPSGPTFLPHIR